MLLAEQTPTQLPPPPRAVHGGLGCAVWGVRLFVLPHMCAGVFLLGRLVASVLLATFGTDVEATVTNAHTAPASKGGTIYYLDYQYRRDGREFFDTETVGATAYATFSAPGTLEGRRPTLRVRHWQLGPWSTHRVDQQSAPWRLVAGDFFIALFWNGILSVFVYAFWVRPTRERSLIRHGEVARGTIVSTRTRQGRGPNYFATFRFAEPATGFDVQREMEISGLVDFASLRPGYPLTVLFDPRKPRRAIAYELCGYRVTGADP